jgi:hypothetical protein
MMTVILTFLKNPKNLLIVALVLIVLTFGTIVLYQRGSLAIKTGKLAEQTAEIERYKVSQKAYADLIDQYANQVVKWQKLAESHQAITNQTAKESVKIKYIKSTCKLENGDAKTVNNIVEYFNTGGRLRDN